MSVEVVIEEQAWDDVGLEALAGRAVAAALERLGLAPAEWEVVVLGCDDARIAALNKAFRGKAQATNVLSWPSAERGAGWPGEAPAAPDPAEPELGDLALAWETCVAEAAEAGRPLDAHVTHLLVHGCLHLLGYDHETEPDAELMERLETGILEGLGIADPYAVA